uniref:RING-type E3 ubiquitin transferase n=1 Tax=Serinus canaria TaxID=9135 RepID=A0A8C9MZ83_SERCA
QDLGELQAESPHNSENQMCPICLDTINNPVSVSWCGHAFCFPCILEWSRNRPVCPICREPFRYLLRKVEITVLSPSSCPLISYRHRQF